MGEKAISTLVAIVTGVIGITILAVIVSQQSNTANVLTAGGNAFSNILKAAVSPVTGGGGIGSSIGSGLLGGIPGLQGGIPLTGGL